MNVGIVGMGLIGGSCAKAFKENSDAGVYILDTDKALSDFLVMNDIFDGVLDDKTIEICDLIIISVYPQAIVEFLNSKAYLIKPNAYVIDMGGIKREICKTGFSLAEKYGFTFVGGHPMAGLQFSGYKYSRANLFSGASMIIVPPTYDDPELLFKVKELLEPMKFGSFKITNAEEHDTMISYTSQLAHIVSNAYVKSDLAYNHRGFSAGSFRDLTRVAKLNPGMWTEIFASNRKPLLECLDTLITELEKYKQALISEDDESMYALLDDGRKIKEKIDRR